MARPGNKPATSHAQSIRSTNLAIGTGNPSKTGDIMYMYFGFLGSFFFFNLNVFAWMLLCVTLVHDVK